MRRLAVVLVATVALSVAAATPAQADEYSNAHVPSSCLYERYWTVKGCTLDGITTPWIISKAEEDKAAKRQWTPKPKPKAKYVKVKPGQTLWRLAVDHRGNGHEWKTIAKLNGIKGTTIHAGSVLRVR